MNCIYVFNLCGIVRNHNFPNWIVNKTAVLASYKSSKEYRLMTDVLFIILQYLSLIPMQHIYNIYKVDITECFTKFKNMMEAKGIEVI